MCGIVGVLSNHEAAPIIVDALRRLEYRGYDSAGVATINESGTLDRRRAVGKLVNLNDLLVHNPLPGKSGIGHTRWATHGAPNVENAHPHRAGAVSVVHNGIIENFAEIRRELADEGINFVTDTDTETVALLAQSHLNKGKTPVQAVRDTLQALQGAYALCFLFEGENDLMIAARKGSPLAIGHGEGEMYVGSDALALAPMTDKITYLEEGDWAVLSRNSVQIFDAENNQTNRAMRQIRLDASAVDKAGYKHFMAKEIAEQPTVMGETINQYTTSPASPIALPEGLDLSQYDRVVMVACGTAYYACLTAKYWFEQVARMPVDLDVASEFRYREPPIPARSLAIFVSQSGETADTLAALRYCQGKAAAIAAVVNVPESSIAREADFVLPTLAGVEVGVASTKAFTCQLMVLASLTLAFAQARQTLSADEIQTHMTDLRAIPGLFNQGIDQSQKIEAVSAELAEADDIIFMGRGQMFPIALEGALKLKEISYIHAEGYASGELKHGPIALIDQHVPVIVIAPRDRLFEKTVSNMQEVLARHGKVVLITDRQGAEHAGSGCWHVITMPSAAELWNPILYALPAQLLAYHTAVAKGTDVDQPRNLAKSVTVE
jgi:glucosamine--fructose-6-phosphate aminotransferase (isomerizing)